ncbi:MAG: N(G),N(G)-dimethylarginine dimethylaminohydrolase [Candidatus Tumulicola sp.]
MRINNAVVRRPGSNCADGITTASLGAPVFEASRAQHAAYCAALRNAGVAVTVLEPAANFPDAHFVEDTAVLAATRAVLTRPGADARLGEVAAIREPLERFFEFIDEIVAPGRLDGGDVCDADAHVYIGLSHRTNLAGAMQLGEILKNAGQTATVIDIRDVPGILHLKSGMSYLGDGRFVAIDALAPRIAAPPDRIFRVRAPEEYGANCIRVNSAVLLPAGHARLHEALARAGYAVVALDMSEFQKMDGGLSCLSLRF